MEKLPAENEMYWTTKFCEIMCGLSSCMLRYSEIPVLLWLWLLSPQHSNPFLLFSRLSQALAPAPFQPFPVLCACRSGHSALIPGPGTRRDTAMFSSRELCFHSISHHELNHIHSSLEHVWSRQNIWHLFIKPYRAYMNAFQSCNLATF